MSTRPSIWNAEAVVHAHRADTPGLSPDGRADFVFQLRRPDVMAWATWLTWGRMGDARSLQRLRADLDDRGIWHVAEDAADWGRVGDLACRWQSWTAYEIALASAAVLLLSPAGTRSVNRRVWATAGLELSLKLAAQTPDVLTPDGAPQAWACLLVAASCALSDKTSPVSQAQGWQRLSAVLNDPAFGRAPSAWRQAAWRLAEVYHRHQGNAEGARHYLELMAAGQTSAATLMARLRLGQSTQPALSSSPPLS